MAGPFHYDLWRYSVERVNEGNDINDYTNCHSEPSALSGAEGAAKNLYCKDASPRSA